MLTFIRLHRAGFIAVIVLVVLAAGYQAIRSGVLSPIKQATFCTQDAKQCPDGSYVGRTGPACSFAECPSIVKKSTTIAPTQSTVTSQTVVSVTTLPQAAATVKYSTIGFRPATTTIIQGQTVDFVNASNHSFWPASNPHPTHSLYPAFDARTSITPGGKYSFTFDKAGTWGYHNHLNHDDMGVIVVKPLPTPLATSTPKK